MRNNEKIRKLFGEIISVLCLSKKKLIHAYGPKKKVIIMDIKKTISLIKRTAKLDVIGIK